MILKSVGNMSQYRCCNPGYLLDSYGIQCLALLGFEQFKALIFFISNILRIAHLNYKKYYVQYKRCERLINNARKQGVNIKSTVIKESLSKTTNWRHCKSIDKSFKWHGECLQSNQNAMKNRWISYQHDKNPRVFKDNNKLAASKKREFEEQEKQLWNEYHNDPKRITNLMLNAVNRRQSYRDIQENRVAVCYS